MRSTCSPPTRSCSQVLAGSAPNTGLLAFLVQVTPSMLVAYPIATGSYCSPAAYHIWYRLSSLLHITLGFMTAGPSQAWSWERTGDVPCRVQLTPSGLVAYPIQE